MRAYLEGQGLPVAKTEIAHRAAHAGCMLEGKTAAELRDAIATKEIDSLWQEIAALGGLKKKGKRS